MAVSTSELSPSPRPRVLLVDDFLPMRDVASRLLSQDCEVLGYVEDGKQVLAAAKEHRPDIIVLDISLPGMSGMMLLPFLRELLPDAVIVMFTNRVSDEYVAEAFRRGADSYVLKNDAHDSLLAAVRRGRTLGRRENSSDVASRPKYADSSL